MRLALMNDEMVPREELRCLGFEAVQVFFGHGPDGAKDDPSVAVVDEILRAGDTRLAAMTLHVDLVDPHGCVPRDVERIISCVAQTAALDGRFGANEKPLLVWHPAGYPAADVDDGAVFSGLCEGLTAACDAAEERGVQIAVEITRGGSVGSAETFLRLKEQVNSDALKVCLDAANFVPDRTPLDRAVRTLGADIAIAHGKDCSFKTNGEVAAYGPAGSGELDYPEYLCLLKRYAQPAYMVLEYYRSREDLLKARDIVRAGL